MFNMYKEKQTFKPKNTLYFSPKFGMMKKHIQEIVLLCLVPVLKKLRLKDFFLGGGCSVLIACKEPQGTGVFTYKMS